MGKVLTDVPGSSKWFQTGYVTYANESKERLLGVPKTLLRRDGAVSESVVRRMALGALRHAKADVAIAVSGIAGPEGGSDEKPVGTVWFGLALRDGRRVQTRVFRCQFRGDRESVRRHAVAYALQAVLEE
jgi:nicotinamide-nucleotide amidase